MKLKDVSSKGKFDVEPAKGKTMKLKDIRDPDQVEEPGFMEDVGHSVAEGIKHPLDTIADFGTGTSYGNILRQPVSKGVSALEAGAQEIGDLFRPEDQRKDFKDRMMENFRQREAADLADYEKAGARSPVATSIGGGYGTMGSAAVIPGKITKVGEPEVWASGHQVASKFLPKILGMVEKGAINTGSAAATEGLGSKEKVFDLDRAGSAGGTSLATQALLELAPRVVRAGIGAGKNVVEKVGKTGLGAIAGGTISHALGLGHDLFGAAGGATIGSLLDMYQPRLAQASTEAAEFLSKNGGQRLGQYGVALEKAAQKGPLALGLTHLIMLDNNPEYAKTIKGNQP